jgi:RimJ/RimL family protein N-acetyltransferase
MSSVEPTIRPAVAADADAIGSVQVRAWQSTYRGVMPDDYLDGLQATERADGWRRFLVAVPAGEEMFVVADEGRVVGFALVGPEHGGDTPEVGELYAINLDPDVWRRGLGRVLLRRATDRLVRFGYGEAVLWVVPDNQRARAFYESEGWTDDGVRRDDEVYGVVVPEMRYRRRRLSEPAAAPG